MEQPLVFNTYPDLASANDAAILLREQGIDTDVVEEARNLDSNYIGQQFSNPYLLYLQGEDFEKARRILEDNLEVNLDDVDPGYMLLSFTNEELIDVMKQKDEWGAYNYKLAEALLKQRNAEVPEVQIALEQTERLRAKEKVGHSGIWFLLIGYLSVVSGICLMMNFNGNVAFMLMPGGIGFLIGWHLSHSKRTLSNGQRVFYYSGSTRLQGSIIFWAGIGISVLRLLLILMNVMTA